MILSTDYRENWTEVNSANFFNKDKWRRWRIGSETIENNYCVYKIYYLYLKETVPRIQWGFFFCFTIGWVKINIISWLFWVVKVWFWFLKSTNNLKSAFLTRANSIHYIINIINWTFHCFKWLSFKFLIEKPFLFLGKMPRLVETILREPAKVPVIFKAYPLPEAKW